MSEERLKRKGEIFLIPFDKISIDDQINNGRIDFGNIQELADSIEEVGLRIPLLVKKFKNEEKYVLIQGKRRYKAIELLIKKGVEFIGIPSMLVAPTYTIENSLFDQITMNDGKPYSSLEQGIVFSQLVERGFNVSEISKKVGKSSTHINSCIEMASLPKKVQNMISSGSVSGLTAVELSKAVKSEDELVEKLENAVVAVQASPEKRSKKVTNKDIKQIANTSPLKKMEEVKAFVVEIDNVDERLLDFFAKFISRMKAGETVESLAELFQK